MVYVEILIILVIIAYGWSGFRRGFVSQIFDLFSMLISLFIALRFFESAAVLVERWGVAENIAKPIGFFILWVLGQLIFYLIILLFFKYLMPRSLDSAPWNRYLGIIVGSIKGLVVVSIILMLFFILPITPKVKDSIIKYPISSFLIRSSSKIEKQMEKVFSGMNSINLFQTVNQTEETTILNFKTNEFSIDSDSENAMVALVNQERTKVGLGTLKTDETIRTVARSHSIDMAKNGYFSHVNLAGKTPADRMAEGSMDYWLAGENIALAPNYQLAEIGFMNSPKHRDNILDPKFGRIGIGIIDLGPYGRMITQNFAD